MDDLSAPAALGDAIRRYASVDRRHLELLHGNVQRRRLEPTERTAFFRELIADSKRVIDQEFAALLADGSGWRERLVAAWMAGIGGHTQQRRRIGELLIESRQTYAGQGYCFALACLGTPTDAQILCDYLDKYLRRPDLYYDQHWAIGALLDIDTQLGSNYAERFTTPDGLWQQWAPDKSPEYLEAQKNRVAELRALVEEARQADPAGPDQRAVSLPAGWVPIPGHDRAVFEAELVAEVSVDLKPNHPLAKRPLVAVAHCSQRDHVLFEIAENPIRWALVELSWSGQPEPGIRPHWDFFASPETAAAGLREHLR
ncbi:DUF6000 family protein [Kitasatospora azatica]|uniref:DUF6000 family protein n=1 Tax=Kitasatospora azatica TaxID=58347 RepID=UPI00068FC9B4|nr:DUF6000 family protein [Kitasatospora azatica]